MNKKGFIASALVDFYAYLVFIVIIFFLLFKYAADAKQQSISSSSDILAGNTYLDAYLKSPVDVDGVEMTFGELIAIVDHARSDLVIPEGGIHLIPLERGGRRYSDILSEQTEAFFSDIMESDMCLRLVIVGEHTEEEFSSTPCYAELVNKGLLLLPQVQIFDLLGGQVSERYKLDPNVDPSRFYVSVPPLVPGEKPVRVAFFYDLGSLSKTFPCSLFNCFIPDAVGVWNDGK